MFSKVLAGALGLAVLATGGVVYYQYALDQCHSGCKSRQQANEVSLTSSSCCSDMSRSTAIHSCCTLEDATPDQAVSAPVTVTEDGREILAIAPREVK